MPKVSLVLPTRNRAHLLTYALASAVGQNFPDIEIIVSDNYCNNEDTKRVFDSFASPRLRYVRTSDLLPMPDSWEFALSHAEGEYITFLTDDCYLFSDAIDTAMAVMLRHNVKIVCWPDTLVYFAPDWLDVERRNLLYIPKYSGECRMISSDEGLRTLFEVRNVPSVPKFLNSLCHRDVVQEVIRKQKRMFLPPAPDFSAAASMLQHVESYVFIDYPLMLEGGFPASIGGSQRFNWGEAAEEFYREFRSNLDFTELIDLRLRTTTVTIAQALENVRRNYPAGIHYEINKRNLVCESIQELAVQESNGADVSRAWQVLDEYLSKQTNELRRAAKSQKLRSRIKVSLWKLREHVPCWETLERLRGFRVLRGDRWGFGNMSECGLLAAKYARGFIGNKGPLSAPQGS